MIPDREAPKSEQTAAGRPRCDAPWVLQVLEHVGPMRAVFGRSRVRVLKRQQLPL